MRRGGFRFTPGAAPSAHYHSASERTPNDVDRTVAISLRAGALAARAASVAPPRAPWLPHSLDLGGCMPLDTRAGAAPATSLQLAHYGVDPVTGFVPSTEPLRVLPEAFAPWESIVPEISALLRSHRIRAVLERLPLLPVEALAPGAERERAMVLLCHFANCWVWGGAEPSLRMPRVLAVPLCTLAEQLGRPPIAHYASMTLNNWRLVDRTLPLTVDNARTQVQFLGGVDEDWFFVASMGVELAGAPLLPVVVEAEAAAREGADEALASTLEAFVAGMGAVHAALEHVRAWCNPDTYYVRVRPYVTGWPAPGVTYEGVWEEPRKFLGGSAAQSSLLQSFDAMLGLAHPDAPAGRYLRAVRAYMPPAHRAFVEDVEQRSRVRARALSGSAPLRAAYNAALQEMERFRDAHMRLAHDFIIRPAGSGSDPTGTGGTALTSFLRGAQETTAGARL